MKEPSLKVGNNRLMALAEYLRTIPTERFYYGTWVGKDWQEKQDLSCGTTACALGWAATMPKFRRLGMRLVVSGYRDGSPVGVVALADPDAMNEYESDEPIQNSMLAARHVFGLSQAEADYIFAPCMGEEDASPKQVARKIRKFVETNRRFTDDYNVKHWRDENGEAQMDDSQYASY